MGVWSLAVSALNGCGKCVDAHEKTVREKGASEELVAAAVRIASVLNALAVAVDCAAGRGLRQGLSRVLKGHGLSRAENG